MKTRKVYIFTAHANIGHVSGNAGEKVTSDVLAESVLEEHASSGLLKEWGTQEYDETAKSWGPVTELPAADTAGDPVGQSGDKSDEKQADDKDDEKQADENSDAGEPAGEPGGVEAPAGAPGTGPSTRAPRGRG